MIRVKICGLTRAEDAALAVALGADAVGFVFWPASPRAVSIPAVRRIVARLPPFVTRVGVFVDASPAEVAAAVAEAGLDAVQLHGDESPADYAGVGARIIKGLALDSDAALAAATTLDERVTPLIDAADRIRRGGTGQRADWDRAATLAGRRPILLAGGIRPDNLAAAVRAVRPWAVDVSSGVEEAPGVKSADRLRDLFGVVARLRVEEA
jgi:phosphoribosylanthranilate isomerase